MKEVLRQKRKKEDIFGLTFASSSPSQWHVDLCKHDPWVGQNICILYNREHSQEKHNKKILVQKNLDNSTKS